MSYKNYILAFLILISIHSYAQSGDTTNRNIVALDTIHIGKAIFYKTNSYAISVDKSMIIGNKKAFKRKVFKILSDSSINDTIWISNYFKARHHDYWDKTFRYICYREVLRKEVVVINLKTGKNVELIECKVVDPLDTIYTLIDVLVSKEILRYTQYFIGTPSF